MNSKTNKSDTLTQVIRKKIDMFIVTCALFSISFVLLYGFGRTSVKKGELADSDCYMHLVRASELWNTGEWFNSIIKRSNAPYGEELHWTRAFDILLLSGAVPLSLFLDFKQALFAWAVIISPFLLFCSVLALRWATRPLLNNDQSTLASGFSLCEFAVLCYFLPGRADHHSILIFLYIVLFGLLMRIILTDFDRGICLTTSTIIALSLWISVESMVMVLFVVCLLGVLWIYKGDEFVKTNVLLTSLVFLLLCFFLLIERPWQGLFAPELDKLSIVHCSIFFCITLFWLFVFFLQRSTTIVTVPRHRILTSLLGIVFITFFLARFFPSFFHGPYGNVDPRIIPLWLNKVKEVRPLFSGWSLLGFSFPLVASLVISLPFLITWSIRDSNRRAWIMILCLVIIYFFLTCFQIRWIPYAQILLNISLAKLVIELLQKQNKTYWGIPKECMDGIIIMAICLSLFCSSIVSDLLVSKPKPNHELSKVSLSSVCRYLTQEQRWEGQQLRILTNIDAGAEILYRTPYEVIGTPYHRNGQGILAAYDIMTSKAHEKALQLINNRHINLILVSLASSGIFSGDPNEPTFYNQLKDNCPPTWCKKIPLPDSMDAAYTLYEIE
ncbi:MAG: hypothetical protein ACMUIP_13495 [bacterium]